MSELSAYRKKQVWAHLVMSLGNQLDSDINYKSAHGQLCDVQFVVEALLIVILDQIC